MIAPSNKETRDFRGVNGMAYDRLRVTRIIQETADARSLVLEVPPELSSRYRYQAGQFLTIRISHPEGAFNRCYSFSSSPENRESPTITVKRVANGKGSNWIHNTLAEGSFIDALPPAGRFVLKEAASGLLLFGAGSGITPLLSIAKASLSGGETPIRLFYANRDLSSVIFRESLDKMASSARLEVIHHLDELHGTVTAAKIKAAVKGYETALVYLCGPGPFMSLVESAVLDAGIPKERIHIEKFEVMSDAPEGIDIAPDDVVPDRLTVHIDGKAHNVAYSVGQTVLEAARLAGLAPMSSCEQGVCASCAAKRLKGDVRMVNNEVYSSQDIAEGWILTCQSHCFGTEVEITYDIA